MSPAYPPGVYSPFPRFSKGPHTNIAPMGQLVQSRVQLAREAERESRMFSPLLVSCLVPPFVSSRFSVPLRFLSVILLLPATAGDSNCAQSQWLYTRSRLWEDPAQPPFESPTFARRSG